MTTQNDMDLAERIEDARRAAAHAKAHGTLVSPAVVAALIKPLEFVKPHGSETLTKCETIIGIATVWTHSDAGGSWFWKLGDIASGTEANEADAKKMLCATYEARIRSTLLPGAAGAVARGDPDEWVVVLREPTPEMYAAAERDWDGRMSARSRGVWQAMLAAAPPAPAATDRRPGESDADHICRLLDMVCARTAKWLAGSGVEHSDLRGAGSKLTQWDLQIDRNAYPQGPTAEGRMIYRLIGWEGCDRGGLLLSEAEKEAIDAAFRPYTFGVAPPAAVRAEWETGAKVDKSTQGVEIVAMGGSRLGLMGGGTEALGALLARQERPKNALEVDSWHPSREEAFAAGEVLAKYLPTAAPSAATEAAPWPAGARFKFGDLVRKKSGSIWRGKVNGFYITEATPIGYAVESAFEPGSTQVWPEAALEPWEGANGAEAAARAGKDT